MNFILHNMGTGEIHDGNTLANPYYTDEFEELRKFDFAVMKRIMDQSIQFIRVKNPRYSGFTGEWKGYIRDFYWLRSENWWLRWGVASEGSREAGYVKLFARVLKCSWLLV